MNAPGGAEAGDSDSASQWDFFISYTQADRRWAEWIAWELEAAGLWDLTDPTNPQRVAVLTDHRGNVNAVAFSPDNRHLATASTDGTAVLYRLPCS